MHWSSWWHAGGMWIYSLLVLIVVGLTIRFAVRGMSRSEPPRESPEEILKMRFARGDQGLAPVLRRLAMTMLRVRSLRGPEVVT